MNKKNQGSFSLRIGLLFSIVTLLGGVLYKDLWSNPMRMMGGISSLTQENRGSARVPASAQERVPARALSASSMGSKVSSADKADAYIWNCQSHEKSIRFKGIGQIRISGKCLKNAKKVTNTNNGYTANIFKVESGATTDYMTLLVGRNNLEFQWEDGRSSERASHLELMVEK